MNGTPKSRFLRAVKKIEIHQTPTNSAVNAYNFIRQSDKVSLKPTTHATEKKKRPVEYLSIGETKLSIQFLRSAMRGHSPQRLMLGRSSLPPHSHAGKAEFQPKSFPPPLNYDCSQNVATMIS